MQVDSSDFPSNQGPSFCIEFIDGYRCIFTHIPSHGGSYGVEVDTGSRSYYHAMKAFDIRDTPYILKQLLRSVAKQMIHCVKFNNTIAHSPSFGIGAKDAEPQKPFTLADFIDDAEDSDDEDKEDDLD